jgi:YegS/Rv2252/BmrU family lipid kinase
MRHVFIINPAAGHRDQTPWFRSEIERCCQGLQYEIHVSHAPGVCRVLAKRAAEQGDEVRIYACGGDGTLNEVASGAAGYPNAAVTHYAGGSGNDFIRMFSDTAPFRDLSQLLDAKEVAFDLVDCNGDLSINICSVGLDARIGTEVAFYKRLPFISGHVAYVVSTVRNVIRGISEHYIVEVEGERIDADQTMICVANGRYYGGGFNPVPEADPTDGKLDVLLVSKVSRLQVAGIVGKYKAGLYRRYPRLVRHFRTDRVRILCDDTTAVNLDGELRRAKTVDISVAKEKIRFFYPDTVELLPGEPKL